MDSVSRSSVLQSNRAFSETRAENSEFTEDAEQIQETRLIEVERNRGSFTIAHDIRKTIFVASGFGNHFEIEAAKRFARLPFGSFVMVCMRMCGTAVLCTLALRFASATGHNRESVAIMMQGDVIGCHASLPMSIVWSGRGRLSVVGVCARVPTKHAHI